MKCYGQFSAGLIIVAVVWVLTAESALAIMGFWVNFGRQPTEFENSVISQVFAKRLAAANLFYPNQPTEIYVGDSGRRKQTSLDDLTFIWAYFRGNPIFCSINGCLLTRLERDDNGKWRKVLDTKSNGFLVGSDVVYSGRALLITEDKRGCRKLIWNGSAYENGRANGKPCFDRLKEAAGELVDEMRRGLRAERIRYKNLRVIRGGGAVQIHPESNRSSSKSILSAIANKRDAKLSSIGNNFQLIFPKGAISPYFILK